MSVKTKKMTDDVLTEREWKRLHVAAVLRAKGYCTLCPPHRGENRSRTSHKRNAGQKPRTARTPRPEVAPK